MLASSALTEHDLCAQREFRHPWHVQGRRGPEDTLPESARSGLIADIEDEVHGTGHLADDSPARA